LLTGTPDYLPILALMLLRDLLKWGKLGWYIWQSRRVAGWTRGIEASALALTSYAIPGNPQVVEIGSYVGSSAVLLAGGRRLRGTGLLHCVDPFDASGEPYSVPFYRKQAGRRSSLRAQFERNLRRAGVRAWVEVHEGTAEQIASRWTQKIDLLFLDGEQSSLGARSAYEAWIPFLHRGGIIALHNSQPNDQHQGHEGYARLASQALVEPKFRNKELIGTTTFAIKVDD
jgi:hypothetical protein